MALTSNLSFDSVAAHKHHHHHNKNNKFAEGYGERENMGESISMKGPTKMDHYDYVMTTDGPVWQVRGDHQVLTDQQQLVDWQDHQTDVANTRIPYASTFVGIREEPAAEGAEGAEAAPAAPKYTVRGDKDAIVQANILEQYGDIQNDAANTRIPYHSTFVMTEEAKERTDAGPLRGDHQVLTDQQSLVDWQDHQTEMANTRIPYASTLMQMQDDSPTPSRPAGPVRGDHQILTDQQYLVDWQDHQTMMANTRIPYHSTFVQLQDDSPTPRPGVIRGDHQVLTDQQYLVDWQDHQTMMANTRIPYASTLLQLSSPIRGDKAAIIEAQDLVNWGDHQEIMANTRPPYNSTLQIKDDEEEDNGQPTKLENAEVPLNFKLIQVDDVVLQRQLF